MKSALFLCMWLMLASNCLCQKRSKEVQFTIGVGGGSMNISQSLTFQNADTSFSDSESYDMEVRGVTLGVSYELSNSIKIGLQLQPGNGSNKSGYQNTTYTDYNFIFYGLQGEWFKDKKSNNRRRKSIGIIFGNNDFWITGNQVIYGVTPQDKYRGLAGKVYANYLQYFGYSAVGFFLRAEAQWSKMNLYESSVNNVPLDISNIEATLKEKHFILQAGLVLRIRT